MPAKTKKAVNAPSISSKPPATATATATAKPLPPPNVTNKSQTAPSVPEPTDAKLNDRPEPASRKTDIGSGQPAVNRKKQKRREKEATKRAAEQRAESEIRAQNGYAPTGRGSARSYFREETDDYAHAYRDEAVYGDDACFSGPEDEQGGSLPNGYDPTEQALNGTIGKKKRRTRKSSQIPPALSPKQIANSSSLLRNTLPGARSPLPHAPVLSAAALRSAHQNFSHNQIWNTSTQAERENIKQFWLELGEEERRSLVKVEKEAVLRKMKEQQKHSCSCTVCGRKRTAIEEELEVLYDAYYEELEQFANHNNDLSNGTPIMSDPRPYGHLRAPRHHPMAGQYPTDRTAHDPSEDDEDLDDEDYDEDEGPYSDDEVEEIPRGPPDFFTFGNSLTVKDGILTVADDLLKNDGKHFIDMMESLAEKRMQREEATHFPSAALAHQDSPQGHNHPPLDEDDDYDDEEEEEEEEEDEDYDSQEEDELEADEMDAMTEGQRMEEGRRMFQIFAARMFEQRVLTAYREKVARERQRKLIEELEEETRLDTQREAKKAREAAKKKEKKKVQKQAKDEEKARKDAEKSAQEAAARAIEQEKLEEQRRRKEEQRKKREGEKRAADEERLKKEAEKQRKVQEERDRQQEAERRQKEAKEREKKKREESRKVEREEKEAKEREARGQKAKEEQERKALDQHARREKEAAMKVEREVRDRARHEEQGRQTVKRPSIAVPPGIHPAHPSALQSPQIQVATPIMPTKAPTPARPRQHSQQGPQSHGSSPRSQPAATTETTVSSTPSSINFPLPTTSINGPGNPLGQGPPLHHPQPSAPLSPLSSQTRSSQPPLGYNGIPGASANGVAPSGLGMMPGMIPQMPMYQGQPMGGPHRGYGPPNGLAFPPGMNGGRQFPHGPAGHFQAPNPMAPAAPVAQKAPTKSQPHSRQQSASYERVVDSMNQPAPISRPAPIGQSSNSTPDKKENRKVSAAEVEQLSTQLGSKALLDDSDIPLTGTSSDSMAGPGAPGSGRAPFSSFPEMKHDAFQAGNWGAFSPNGAFAGPPHWGAPGLTPKQGGGGWPTPHPASTNAFGFVGGGIHTTTHHRSHASRPVAIRLMAAEACKRLSASPGSPHDGFHPAQVLLRQMDQMRPPHEPAVSLNELLLICDTEGNAQNGGGSFVIQTDGFPGPSVKFEPSRGVGDKRAVGDIGSPMVGHTPLATFGGIGQPVSGTNKGH